MPLRLVEREPERYWQTPLTNEHKHEDYTEEGLIRKSGRVRDDHLATQVLYFPEGRGNSPSGDEKIDKLKAAGYVSEEERRALGLGVKLNPEWVEWLMGWPIGWTSLEPMKEGAWETWEAAARSGSLWDRDPGDDGTIPRALQGEDVCPNRARRLVALGNGQVPSCAALAMDILSQKAEGLLCGR